jgi:hypothetical protein
MADPIFNIWDQAAMTVMTQAAVERVLGSGRERIASNFLPITPTEIDKIAKERLKIRAVGKGRIIADDATPPIYRPKTKLVEEMYELFRISEMTPVEESLRRQLELNGTDQESVNRRRRAGVDIVTRFRSIQVRNENESDYLSMYAILNGQLPIDVANSPDSDTDDQFVLDYEYPATHLAVVSTSFANIAASAPITYMRAWQQLIRQDSGEWGTEFWFSSEVWQYIIDSTQVRNSLTFNQPITGTYIPSEDNIKSLLYQPDQVEFHIEDSGWYEETAGYKTELDVDKTRWIPKDRMIVKVKGNQHKGEPIAQMYDGMVPVQTDWDAYQYRGPGPQSYVQLIPGNLTLMGRNEMRRLPMINHPECIVSAQVVL